MYLRDNASLQGRVIDVMPQGTSVEVYGMTQDGWYHVNYEGTEGYCYYRWLNFEGTADGTVHDGKQTEMFATCDLNVRDAPGMHGKVIGVLTTDEAVAVSHKENYWFTVDYHGQTGYCYGEYLGFTRGGYQDPNDTAGRNVMNDEVEGGATSTMNQLTVTAPLNVRTAPSMSGAIIGSLARGTVVSALEQTPDRWVRISFNGTDAWVFGDYLA